MERSVVAPMAGTDQRRTSRRSLNSEHLSSGRSCRCGADRSTRHPESPTAGLRCRAACRVPPVSSRAGCLSRAEDGVRRPRRAHQTRRHQEPIVGPMT
jgi:hypothetical protein